MKYTPPLKSLHQSSSAQISFFAMKQQRNPLPPFLLFEPFSSFSFYFSMNSSLPPLKFNSTNFTSFIPQSPTETSK
jgi:hypothetical protein